MTILPSGRVRVILRRICVSAIVLALLLYLPTLYYLSSSFSDSPEREAFHSAIDTNDYNSQKQVTIPKVIHQIWMGNRKPPERYVRCARSWQKLEKKGYEYRLWNETGLVAFFRKHHPYILDRWVRYKYTMNRVDSSKYFLLFTFGGIFADMDVCNVAPDPIERAMSPKMLGRNSERRVILVKGQPAGVNPEIMITFPRHPFFRHCLRFLYDSDRRYVLPYIYMMCVGGPCFLTGAYQRYKMKHRHILLLSYQEAMGSLFTPVKGGEWYTWDSKLLIEWIYFGIIHAHIVPIWLSSLILAISVTVLAYYLKTRFCHGATGVPVTTVTQNTLRWIKSHFIN